MKVSKTATKNVQAWNNDHFFCLFYSTTQDALLTKQDYHHMQSERDLCKRYIVHVVSKKLWMFTKTLMASALSTSLLHCGLYQNCLCTQMPLFVHHICIYTLMQSHSQFVAFLQWAKIVFDNCKISFHSCYSLRYHILKTCIITLWIVQPST